MADIEKNIIDQAIRFNEPIPDRIQNKPVLGVSSLFFFNSFIELDTDRPHGMSAGPIPWTSLHAYAMFHALSGELYDDFFCILRKMDTAWLKHLRNNNGNVE
jgi:hypothetical protein